MNPSKDPSIVPGVVFFDNPESTLPEYACLVKSQIAAL